ncbi:MAG: T9SS type A sorting domain-containing protein [Bacteroidia bacterium]
MKNYFYIAFLFLSLHTFSQNVFWSENFGTGCTPQYANGFSSSNGNWSAVVTGTQGINPNAWFVSSAEAGMGVGNCGDGCGNNPNLNNSTLHVSVDFGPGFQDFGATYIAGPGYESDVRAQSPVINCSGQNNITLSFLYMLEGVPGVDYFEVQYSSNGGSTWSVIATPPPTNNSSCAGQGLWTSYTIALPASANNNTNVKLGFHWVNTDANGADPAPAIDDIQLSAPVVFAPTFTVNSPVCVGTQQQLTANTGTFAVSGYTWSSTPTGPIFSSPNASSTVISFTSSGTFSVMLTATSGTTTATDVHVINVSMPASITAASNPNIGCAGQQFTLVATGAMSYTWNPGNLTGSNVIVTPGFPTTYTVTGTMGGCTSSANTNVGMYNSPVVNASSSASMICMGSSATLSASGASSYTWSPGGANGNSVVVSPTTSTTFTVVGSNGFCTNTKTVSLNVSPCTSISKINGNENVYSLYPNPASDKLQIVSAVATEASLEVMDVQGKIIIKQGCSFKAADNTQTINIMTLPPGVYLMKVISSNTTAVMRFIKE